MNNRILAMLAVLAAIAPATMTAVSRFTLAQPHARAAPVFFDEFDAGQFQRGADRIQCTRVRLAPSGLEVGKRRMRDVGSRRKVLALHREHGACAPALFGRDV